MKNSRIKNSKINFSIIIFIIFLSLSYVLAAPLEKSIPVTIIEVIAQNMREEISLAATVEPLQESEISSRVPGVVEKIYVNEGDWVNAGQKILSLDLVIAEIEVKSARAKVNEAIARHKDAMRQKNEFQTLIDHKAVSTTSLASAVADEEAARANVAWQRAELMRLKELLSRHVLTAPFSGVVVKKYVDVGQWVTADSAVLKLVALDRVRIRASLPQRYYSRIDMDASTRIVFDALQYRTFSGKPSALVAVGNQSIRSFPVLINLDNTQHDIAPGMSARIYIELSGSEKKALLIPRDAIVLKADGGRMVWQVIEVDGKSEVKPVKLLVGRTHGDLVEVLDSSLKVGDRIVLLGNENLRPGQTVQLN